MQKFYKKISKKRGDFCYNLAPICGICREFLKKEYVKILCRCPRYRVFCTIKNFWLPRVTSSLKRKKTNGKN